MNQPFFAAFLNLIGLLPERPAFHAVLEIVCAFLVLFLTSKSKKNAVRWLRKKLHPVNARIAPDLKNFKSYHGAV
jgi:hypothetical protein